eukprot:9192224-Pyramimonas_sp.AAC.1
MGAFTLNEFQNVLASDEAASDVLFKIRQECWAQTAIPESWERANVELVFKRDYAALPENYRAISLLPVGRKMPASMLRSRLVQGGAETRIRDSQFGFWPRRGAGDALMLTCRMIDAAHLRVNGGLFLILLDWAKAFDIFKPDCMCDALERFGLPSGVVELVRAIYSAIFFTIED